jgi:hypothetical protein
VPSALALSRVCVVEGVKKKKILMYLVFSLSETSITFFTWHTREGLAADRGWLWICCFGQLLACSDDLYMISPFRQELIRRGIPHSAAAPAGCDRRSQRQE